MLNRKSSIAAGLLALGALGAAGTAQAADVHWSIGVNLPAVGTVISNAPVYQPVYQPVYEPVYQPPRHVYAPPPVVVYQPVPRVVYRPVPVYAPRYYEPRGVHGGWVPGPRHGHWDRGHHDDDHGHRGGHGRGHR